VAEGHRLELPKYSDYQFEAKYGDLKTDEIEFGDFRGPKKWERVTQIPQQPSATRSCNLIVYQGDTEFASVEQQRNLLQTSPSDYDTTASAGSWSRRCATDGRCATCS
jgi:benzoyl-CoA 2,3-dioxygenase component B